MGFQCYPIRARTVNPDDCRDKAQTININIIKNSPTLPRNLKASIDATSIAEARERMADDDSAEEGTQNQGDDDGHHEKKQHGFSIASPGPLIVEEQSHFTSRSNGGINIYSSDVWYRRFVKPLTRRHRPIPYRDSFQRRMLQPVGIPVAQLGGLHGFFQRPSYVQYSPLIGMLFSYNHFIDNLYRYGDAETEPGVQLVQMLFHALPGGDIQTTHLGACAGAHMSPSIIGRIFEAWEAAKRDIETGCHFVRNDQQAVLFGRFLSVIEGHSDYRDSLRSLRMAVARAKAELQSLHQRDVESQVVRDRIKILEGDVIKRGRHHVKRARKELQKMKQGQNTSIRESQKELEEEIAAQERAMDEAEVEVERLRLQIVTSADFKVARKAVRRAQAMVDQQQESRQHLAATLARSFLEYDIPSRSSSCTLPRFMTTAVLLAYIWRKYDSVEYLEGYFESMDRIGALNVPSETAKSSMKELVDVSVLLVQGAAAPFRQHLDVVECPSCAYICPPKNVIQWSANDIAAAASIVTSKPGLARRPPIVPFSYITWAHYSEFPDCGENALRNLINQLLYNPITNLFDHELLEELRDRYYPRMERKLIDFFEKNSVPRDSTDYSVAKEWIEVCSYLNHGLEKGEMIRYRREKQQQNIASPLRNVLRVFNALFGIRPTTTNVGLEELVSKINTIRNWDLRVFTQGIKDDGFGILGISDGKIRYELQSYKPVHFGFVQVETFELDKLGRRDFEIFCKLERIVNSRNANSNARSRSDPICLELLGLASLFVPYDFDRSKRRTFFSRFPPHYRVWFAELNGSLQQEHVIQWATIRHGDDPILMDMVNRIRQYTEPSFISTSPASAHSSNS